jgi:hypothetical protein
MSQKADISPAQPKSYTSVNLMSTFGEYDMDHLFDKVPSRIVMEIPTSMEKKLDIIMPMPRVDSG